MVSEEKKQNSREIIFLIMIFVIMLVTFSNSFFNKKELNRKRETASGIQREKVVTTVKIKKGSTLWDIAAEYCSEEYQSVDELVEEIKISNGIKQNTIHEGAYLIVPYYVSSE